MSFFKASVTLFTLFFLTTHLVRSLPLNSTVSNETLKLDNKTELFVDTRPDAIGEIITRQCMRMQTKRAFEECCSDECPPDYEERGYSFSAFGGGISCTCNRVMGFWTKVLIFGLLAVFIVVFAAIFCVRFCCCCGWVDCLPCSGGDCSSGNPNDCGGCDFNCC